MNNTSKKSPAILAAMTELANHPEAIPFGGCCAWCGTKRVSPQDFKDDLSRKEFLISFMCQTCQDKTFEEEEC